MHSVMVAEYTYLLGKQHDPKNAFLYYLGGISHDFGKITFPDSILKGEKIVNESERMMIKRHVHDAVQFMSKFGLPQVVMNIVKYHHERFDGNGYLEGLKGYDIPLEARIASLADVYCAIRDQGRQYQKKRSHVEAISILKKSSGQFDPDLLKSFCELADEYELMMNFKEVKSIEKIQFPFTIIPHFGANSAAAAENYME
ncbi:HD-GYP domain-containing protein [Neobacillus pocheonensis]|uniref:HD-GYP domain-containing protein n=1 Tax=Neobacillus pocheonensis TaxID=363869 RepID=UPI003D2B990F